LVLGATMLPNLGGLSLRCAPTLTNAPATMGAGARAHESTNVNGRTKKQKVDPNEPSAEQKRAAYAAKNAAPEHEARIEAVTKEREKVEQEMLDMTMSLMGDVDAEAEERYDELVKKANRLQAELETLKAAPAPMDVEPERMPYQTEAQKRIRDLHQKVGRTAEEEEELQSLRSGIRKAREDKAREEHEVNLLMKAETRLENRRNAIADPKHWRTHLKRGLSKLPKGEENWWEAMGRHLAAQKAMVARDARVQAAARAAGRGPPPAAPHPRHRIAWPLNKLGTGNECKDVVNELNKQLESFGLAEIESLRGEHQAREARLRPVRDQLKVDDAAAEQAAKEAKVNAAEQAKLKKGKQHQANQKAQARNQQGAKAQDALNSRARSQELARLDREAQAGAPPGKRRA